MVTLGFFNVAGQNDLPYVSTDFSTSDDVQRSLLSYAASADPGAGVRPASAWNLALCDSCSVLDAFPSAALYNRPGLQVESRRLATGMAVGLSTASTIQGWRAGPDDALAQSCWSACADFPQTANFWGGGFNRPYAVHEPPLPGARR